MQFDIQSLELKESSAKRTILGSIQNTHGETKRPMGEHLLSSNQTPQYMDNRGVEKTCYCFHDWGLESQTQLQKIFGSHDSNSENEGYRSNNKTYHSSANENAEDIEMCQRSNKHNIKTGSSTKRHCDTDSIPPGTDTEPQKEYVFNSYYMQPQKSRKSYLKLNKQHQYQQEDGTEYSRISASDRKHAYTDSFDEGIHGVYHDLEYEELEPDYPGYSESTSQINKTSKLTLDGTTVSCTDDIGK